MAGQKQPIELVLAKGKKHLTQAEIEERQATEIKPLEDKIIAPDNLTKKQKDEFYKIADQLSRMKIMSVTDVDTLARYIISRDNYFMYSKSMRSTAVKNNIDLLERYSRLQDRSYKQCHSTATALGLTIASRCKLEMPRLFDNTPKENKFNKFKKTGSGG